MLSNCFADRYAKAAAEDARLPADAREAHQASQWRAQALLKARGAILAKWLPPGSKSRGHPEGQPRHRLGVAGPRYDLRSMGLRQMPCRFPEQLHIAQAAAEARHKLFLADAKDGRHLSFTAMCAASSATGNGPHEEVPGPSQERKHEARSNPQRCAPYRQDLRAIARSHPRRPNGSRGRPIGRL
jgi:hypothetical protein